jgi:uncharacterized protein YejL (UPF0352 family)
MIIETLKKFIVSFFKGEKQLDNITKDVVEIAAKNKLSDDLTLISIGK